MIKRLRPTLAPRGTSLRSFWTFQAIFWSFIFFWRILYNFAHGFDVSWAQVTPRVISISISAVMVLFLGHVAVRLMPTRLKVERLLLIIGFTLLLALFLSFTDRLVFAICNDEASVAEVLRFDVPKNYFFSAWMFVSWVVLFLLIAQFSRLRERENAIYRLKSSEKEARMQMLVHQLNPHFLFNSLNSISALINESRSDDADLMISRLSRFLRHVIDPDPAELIRLDSELAISSDYIDIQKIRYGDQLQVTIESDNDRVRLALVPKLILQPLIENSIKYGRRIPGHVTRISVAAIAHEAEMVLSIEDNGPGFPPTPSSSGLGLNLVRERLEAHYGDGAALTTQNLDPEGSRVEIRMPLMTATRSGEDAV